jgi:tetratricopeptide (TPR) repeat protein
VYAAAALCLLWHGAAALRAADEPDWRSRALALNDVTGDLAIAGEIRDLSADPAKAKKLLSVAMPLAKEKNQPFNYNAAYILASTALQVKDPKASQVFYQICAEQAAKLRSVQKLVQAYSGMLGVIDQLYVDKKYDESAKLCQSFLEMLQREQVTDRLKDDVLRRMIRALARQGKKDEANRMVETLLKASGGKDWRNLELKGWLQRESEQSEEAAKTYEEVLGLIREDKNVDAKERGELADEVRYLLSGIYMDANHVDKAAEQLKTLLKEHPDEPTYNNDLGYIWADHDMNLDEAERMIRKAVEGDRKKRQKDSTTEDKDAENANAAYLDSLGWVLFKRGRYEEAKPYLLQAAQDKDGQHIEIYDHLGEVNLALGDKDGAVAAWKKGIDLAGTTRREQERKAEVANKLKKLKP